MSEFDRVVEPLRRDHALACEEFVAEVAAAVTDEEAMLSWQGLRRAWLRLDGEHRGRLKAFAREQLSRPAVHGRDAKMRAIDRLQD